MTRLAMVCAALFAVGCGDDAFTPPDDAGSDLGVGDLPAADLAMSGANAARGEYLVKHLLFCGGCHTPNNSMGMPDQTKFLAGGGAFPAPGFGADGGVAMVFAANLTPDPTTGLGGWSTSNIVDALTVGVDKDGNPLFPIMPYNVFGNLTADDATSIALYLQSLPPLVNAVPKNTGTFPQAVPRLADAQIPHTALVSSDPDFAAAERGRYLAKVSCISCHTPRGPGILLGKAFAGGETFHLPTEITISANLTPDATGLAGWTVAEIVATMKMNQERGTGRKLCPPMPGGLNNLGGLTDGDLTDTATFIHTLAPIKNGPFGCNDAGVPFNVPDGG